MSKASQTQKVLEYIKANGSIDPWRAMSDLRIMRLGARIFDLKAQGIPIVTEIKTNTTANGEHTKWAEYRLGENAP
jgi:hypothetical protein